MLHKSEEDMITQIYKTKEYLLQSRLSSMLDDEE